MSVYHPLVPLYLFQSIFFNQERLGLFVLLLYLYLIWDVKFPTILSLQEVTQ